MVNSSQLDGNGRPTQPFDIRLIKQSQIFEPQLQHGDPRDSQAPGQHGMLDAERRRDLFSEDPRSSELYPSQAVYEDLRLNRGLGVGEIARPESHLFKTHLGIKLFQDAKQMAEGHVFVHDNAFQLLELRCMRGIDGLAPVDAIYSEGFDRGPGVVGEILDGHASGMGAQNLLPRRRIYFRPGLR